LIGCLGYFTEEKDNLDMSTVPVLNSRKKMALKINFIAFPLLQKKMCWNIFLRKLGKFTCKAVCAWGFLGAARSHGVAY
jgi:hypothetical protein